MVLPLIVAIGGRVAVSVILRAIAANRTRAIAKYGSGAVNKALKMSKTYKGKDKSVLQAIGKVTKKVKTSSKKAVTKGIDYTYKVATKGIKMVKKLPSKKTMGPVKLNPEYIEWREKQKEKISKMKKMQLHKKHLKKKNVINN